MTVHLKTDVNINQRIDYDVIAETPGGDPNRILMVGAHIDGVNAGPGINDDGSGTAMNLAIAHQLMQQGMTPKYKIRFGWFSGEEQGLFGSQFYVNTLNTLETSRILGMLDYDMIASTNFIPFVYTDGATVPSAETILGGLHIDYLKQRLNIDSTPYIFDNRSDYAGFRTRGVPATGLYTGAETVKTAEHVAKYGGQIGIQADPCYHEWCDTVFNLSEFGMNEFTDALAHAVLVVQRPGGDRAPGARRQLAGPLRSGRGRPRGGRPRHGCARRAAEDRGGVLLDGVRRQPERRARSRGWWRRRRARRGRRARAGRRRRRRRARGSRAGVPRKRRPSAPRRTPPRPVRPATTGAPRRRRPRPRPLVVAHEQRRHARRAQRAAQLGVARERDLRPQARGERQRVLGVTRTRPRPCSASSSPVRRTSSESATSTRRRAPRGAPEDSSAR